MDRTRSVLEITGSVFLPNNKDVVSDQVGLVMYRH